ncbi:DUF1134 domain-containing protein [Rhodomicrobium udaipurense]|uniref:DUF1134 domain-containing protein n=1 Tax=Rhodomicrobium udaipurense TaxID=1202716 RepID=A0A8I1GDR2_9HYPH|nr:DUF1134 domain-containing protein [Rhodomicrobium udaipurense]MBJ7542999.1 DUF1134 domain-containing protein [Rhodomicrobium udaipurense]
MTFRHKFAVAAFFAIMPASGDAAQNCDGRAFSQQIDQTAQALRTLNRDSEARFQNRLVAIAKAKGWSEGERADHAAAAMDDTKLESFNSDIEDLVGQLDTLNATPKNEISCDRLNELKTINDKLIGVMRQKAGFILAQLEAEAGKPAPNPYKIAGAGKGDALPREGSLPQTNTATPIAPDPEPNVEVAGENSPVVPDSVATSDVPWSANVSQALRNPQPQQQARPAATTATTVAPHPNAPMSLKPAPKQEEKVAALTPPRDTLPPVTVTSPPPSTYAPPLPAPVYSVQEIRDAGRGVFGSVTSELAAVMNYAFQKFGQPNAYIVGDEGGGAFLAGLRYGDGRLFSRVNGVESGPTKIYWQGPSFGADFGASGSRALFLVYNLDSPHTLYRRFPGLDGSAYVAGGVGLTVYKNGDTLIVPIRTGLGLRIGASVAYLKFTERASLNPF